MDKQNVIYPKNGLLITKWKEILTHATTWINTESIK